MAASYKPPHPLQNQPTTPSSSSASLSSSNITSFPIAAITILGILTTGILLLSYYLFVINCSRSLRRRRGRTLFSSTTSVAAVTAHRNKGLDHRTIDSLPTLRFGKTAVNVCLNAGNDCPVCLNDFSDGELLRLLPACRHSFHIDCIDTWLQSNPNCPLCRREIAAHNILTFSDDAAISINIGAVYQDRQESSEREGRRIRKARKGASKGDECINIRGCKDEFVQPIRRSFSMDSCSDPELYLSVQEIFKQRQIQVDNDGEENGGSTSGGGGKIGRRSLFLFGHGRSCVCPVELTEV